LTIDSVLPVVGGAGFETYVCCIKVMGTTTVEPLLLLICTIPPLEEGVVAQRKAWWLFRKAWLLIGRPGGLQEGVVAQW
jgi:hypothetical protein